MPVGSGRKLHAYIFKKVPAQPPAPEVAAPPAEEEEELEEVEMEAPAVDEADEAGDQEGNLTDLADAGGWAQLGSDVPCIWLPCMLAYRTYVSAQL
jgi:hypothetical protein